MKSPMLVNRNIPTEYIRFQSAFGQFFVIVATNLDGLEARTGAHKPAAYIRPVPTGSLLVKQECIVLWCRTEHVSNASVVASQWFNESPLVDAVCMSHQWNVWC